MVQGKALKLRLVYTGGMKKLFALCAAAFSVATVSFAATNETSVAPPRVAIVVPANGSETAFTFTMVVLTDVKAECSYVLNQNEQMIMEKTGGIDHRQFFLDLLPKPHSISVTCTANGVSTTAVSSWVALAREPEGDEAHGPEAGTLTFPAPAPVVVPKKTDRELANDHLPLDIRVDALVKAPGDDAVYLISEDAKRHPFPNARFFFSWYTDFNDVRTVTADTLAAIPLGTSVLLRPGTDFVKIVSSPETYMIGEGGVLRWIPDERVARALGGDHWQDRVIDIDPSLFTLFTLGSPVAS